MKSQISNLKSGKRVFIAIASYGGLPVQFLSSYAAILGAKFPKHIKLRVGDSLVSRARNILTADFLATDCTHLLFVDSDILCNPFHLQRITMHDEPVVGGCYPLKAQGELRWCLQMREQSTPRADGLQEVDYIGTGFLLTHRSVFERMLEQDRHEIEYHCDETDRLEHDFWRCGVREVADGRRRYLSEDWFFCQRWRELGGKVFADTHVSLMHCGHAAYPLKSQLAELADSRESTNA